MKSEFWKPFFHIFTMKILTKSYQVGFACSEADKRNLQPIPGTAKSGRIVGFFIIVRLKKSSVGSNPDFNAAGNARAESAGSGV